ncbi:MAG TPA: sugar-binding protein, partial [Pseudoalteromonas sp.]|nr:sugar-binding protein [Pseudoalteromonas sp.]
MKKTLLAFSLLFAQPLMAIDVSHTPTAITIDGVSESAWNSATWHSMPHLMDGTLPSSDVDFKGRYRLLWDENYLYLQADISDDVLIDTHPDPTDKYWDDDALEVFI